MEGEARKMAWVPVTWKRGTGTSIAVGRSGFLLGRARCAETRKTRSILSMERMPRWVSTTPSNQEDGENQGEGEGTRVRIRVRVRGRGGEGHLWGPLWSHWCT